MGYEIIYGTPPGRPSGGKVWVALILALSLLAGGYLIRDRQFSRESEAALCLVEQVSEGESMIEALRTYCRTMIEHGMS